MSRPRILVTGASGFVGRRLLDALKDRYEVVGLARRSQARSGAPLDPNIQWHQVDIADKERLDRIFDEVASEGPIRTVVHLAAHYDFEDGHDDEYYRTNVEGLRNVLEACKRIRIENLVFSSSLAACSFPPPGSALTEKSPPDGDHIYARTKALGEAMLAEYQDDFKSVIVRFAAMFSDWCEYPPLFMFIETWLSKAWNRRILGGQGKSAIPYLHVRDGVTFLESVLDQLDGLYSGEILIASTDGAVSHEELYYAVNHYYYGDVPMPIHVPKFLARIGIHLRCLLGSLTGEMPFERPWMAKYIDLALTVDASHTRERLGWIPRERLKIERRVSFLLENLKSDPVEWLRRNRAAMKQVHMRPNLRVAALLLKHKDRIAERFTEVLQEKAREGLLPSYGRVGDEEHRWNHRLILRNLINAVRTRDRSAFLAYCQDVAERRWQQGFRAEELCSAIETLGEVCLEILDTDEEAYELEPYFYDHLTVTMRFGVDHVIEVFERMERQRRRATSGGGPTRE